MSLPALERRFFLKVAAGTGAAVFGLGLDALGRVVLAQQAKADVIGSQVFGPWLTIRPDNIVTLVSPETEYGQGTITANAVLVAEELDADWSKIAIVQSDAARVYVNPRSHRLSTDGSMGTRGRFDQLRRVGATARLMLVQAAAGLWSVPVTECTTANSMVTHAASNRAIIYGALAAAAANLPLPAAVELKSMDKWRRIGTAVPRLDIVEKCTGRAKYAVDHKMPGLLHAAFARCPVLGGTVKTLDDSAVRARAGVRQVISVGYGVAVLADDPWTARSAAESLKVEWDSPAAAVSSETLALDYADALANKPGVVAKKVGDVEAVEAAAAGRTLEAEYTLPYLTQQCMEPTNATAWVHDGICELWTPTASMDNVVKGIGYLLKLPPESIKVHRAAFVGGSFGLRGRVDPELEAAQLSQKAGAPVQVVRRREEDVQHGWYRPYEKVKVKGVLNANGDLVSWRHKVAVQAINAHLFDELIPFGIDIAPVNESLRAESAFYRMPVDFYATSGTPMASSYQIPNVLIEGVQMEVPVPVTHWRSVGYSGNTFVLESFLDELAHRAARDPIDLRRSLVKDKARFVATLDTLAAESAWVWPRKRQHGVGWGMAAGDGFECFCAAAVEVAVTARKINILRIICVYDQGITVNLDQTEAQVQGGIIDGLSTALYGEITLRNGRVQQTNFNDYSLYRLAQMPPIHLKRIDSGANPGSITEMITPMIIPALTNAIFAATGERIRELPLQRHGFHV